MPLDVVERHPKRVKAAVRHCARLGNMSAKQVAALAAEGRFPDPFGDLEPHEIPASYVGAIMRDERARMRREAGAPAEQLLAELRSILAEDVRSIRRRRRGETRIRALQAATKATAELVRLERLLAGNTEKDGQQKTGKAGKDEPSTADRLNRAAKRKAEQHDPTAPHSLEGEGGAAPSSTTNGTPSSETSDPVLPAEHAISALDQGSTAPAEGA
jgi:hypothetical protein